MATNYVQPGDTIEYAHGSAVDSGELITIGDKVGVALGSFEADEAGSYAVDGVFEVPKASAADAMGVGASAYEASGEATDVDDSGSNTYAGFVTEPAGAGDTTVRIKLNA